MQLRRVIISYTRFITTENISVVIAIVDIAVTIWLVYFFSKKLNITIEKVNLFKTTWLSDMEKIEQALETLIDYNILQKQKKIDKEYDKTPMLLVTDIGDRITSLNKSINNKIFSHLKENNEIQKNFDKTNNAYISFKKIFTQYTEPKKIQTHRDRTKLENDIQKEAKKFKVSLRNYKYSIIDL